MAAKKKSIDGTKLIKMVEDKVPRPEIMKKLNIKTSNQLTLAYARAQMEAGKIPQIASGNLILILFGRFKNAAFHMPFSSENPFLKIYSSDFLPSF